MWVGVGDGAEAGDEVRVRGCGKLGGMDGEGWG